MWYIPDSGLSCNLNEWLIELRGHRRRVGLIEWHPTAENVLASSGFDYVVKTKEKYLILIFFLSNLYLLPNIIIINWYKIYTIL